MRKSVQISLLVCPTTADHRRHHGQFTATAEPVTNEFTAGTVRLILMTWYAVEKTGTQAIPRPKKQYC